MRRLPRVAVLCAAASLASCPARAEGIGGPVSGFVLDARVHALRPIAGLPGAARLGAPLALPFPVGMAAAAAPLDYAIVTDARDGAPMLVRGLAGGALSIAPLTGAAAPSRIVIAPSGAAAALYSASGNTLQFVSGLPAQPQAGDAMDVSPVGPLAGFAVDSAGKAALLAATDGGIYWLSAGSAPRFILRIPGATAAALLPNGRDALISTTTGCVAVVRDAAGAATLTTLGGAAAGLDSAAALAAFDGQTAAVIDTAGRLALIDLNTGALTWVALASGADRFEPLGGGLYALNGPSPRPLLLLDPARSRGAYFVPPVSADTQPVRSVDPRRRQ